MKHAGKITAKADAPLKAPDPLYRFGTFWFRPSSSELFRGRKRIPLKGQSARVLGILLEKHGTLVSRKELIERIWPDRTVEFDLNLNSCLRDIRQALGDNPKDPRFVETLSKRGYRFIGEVTVVPASPLGRRGPTLKGAGLAIALATGAFFTAWHLAYPYLFEAPRPAQKVQREVAEEARALMLAGASALYDNEFPKTGEALALFERAVQADPGFIEAYLMTARTVFARGSAEDAPRALAAIGKILDLDPQNVEAMAMAGAIKQTLLFDYQGAQESYQAALKADPTFSRANIALAGIFLLRGDPEGSLSLVKRALNIDAIRMTNSGQVGWFYYLAGHYREGLGFCLETLEVNPESASTYSCFVDQYLALGNQEKAAEYAFLYLTVAGLSEAEVSGLQGAAPKEVLEFMFGFDARESTPGRFNPSRLNQALALTRLGKPGEALEVLNLAFEERNYFLPFVAVIPDFKKLNREEGFQRLVRAMNLQAGP